ncbi:MAG TPA: hypothetical protein VGP97_23685 [Burkholderiales bacterium]|jgi:hypothetical protein|nr:hypothetical protein [Burkholderiales bacterium]
MRGLILLVLIAAAACTPVEWSRKDTTPEQFGQDFRYCRQEAWLEAQWRSSLFLNRQVVPFSAFGGPFGNAYIDESRLTAFCLRAKGYELVPLKPQT